MQCSLGFEKKSFSADSDLIIKSGIADSMPGSFDILAYYPPPLPNEVVHSDLR